MNLPLGWYTAGSCAALWGKAATYKHIPFEALPALGQMDGSFAWLKAAPEPSYGMLFGIGDEESREPPEDDSLNERAAEARKLGLELPATFLEFFRSADLPGRVSTCTACYYDFGTRLIPVPGHDGPERLLRFLMDQQTCLMWYLLLEPNGKHRVVVAYPEWTDADDAETFEDAAIPAGIEECAPSFEAFIRRFWLENLLWDEATAGHPLTGELAAYAAAARDAVRRGLVSDSR